MTDVLLFSYGTLRQPEVQLAVFGRLLEGREAAVVGFRLDWLTITDPAVVATSGSDRHPLLVPAIPGEEGSTPGTVFAVTAAELAAADDYEVGDYTRVEVPLDTGETAWVYVFAGAAGDAGHVGTADAAGIGGTASAASAAGTAGDDDPAPLTPAS